MVHLVMRRTYEDAPEHATERNPHVRMLEMHIGMNSTRMMLVSDSAYWYAVSPNMYERVT